MECLLFAGGECWIKDDFLKVVLSVLPVFLPFGVCINAGRGELTLFTSASCCIKISSVCSFSDTVVTAGSVSMADDSDWLPSVLLEVGGVLLSTALVFCLWPMGEEKVGFWLTLSLTKPLEGSMSAKERGMLSP